MLHESDLTYKIRGCIFEVANTLGHGFLEQIYEHALAIELEAQGLAYKRQHPIQVFYKETLIGNYIADIVVEDLVLLELKACSSLLPQHEAQLLNYLRATGIRVGLLINFGQPKVEIKRFVFGHV